MRRSILATSVAVATGFFATSHISQAAQAGTAPVRTEKAACASAKRVIAARGHFPISAIALCDFIVPEERPKGYYVLGLHGKRDDCGGDVCGSTLMGWFAIKKSTGQVFEFDLEEWRPGRLIGQ
jgi:hypothetical protein